jgi:hypothetical protein
MPGPPSELADAMRDRYVIERELGRGGGEARLSCHALAHSLALRFPAPRANLRAQPESQLRERDVIVLPDLNLAFSSRCAAGGTTDVRVGVTPLRATVERGTCTAQTRSRTLRARRAPRV